MIGEVGEYLHPEIYLKESELEDLRIETNGRAYGEVGRWKFSINDDGLDSLLSGKLNSRWSQEEHHATVYVLGKLDPVKKQHVEYLEEIRDMPGKLTKKATQAFQNTEDRNLWNG